MLDANIALQREEIRIDTVNGAIYDVRCKIEDAPDRSAAAAKLLHEVIGVDVKFTDARIAVAAAQRVVMSIVNAKGIIGTDAEAQACVERCIAEATRYVNDPVNAHHFAEEEKIAEATTMVAVAEDLEIKVEVKANGKIKKGGKGPASEEMYQKRVITAPVGARISNQEFIAMLMKELDMSKPGATTYAYNCDNKFGHHLRTEGERREVEAKKERAAKKAAEVAAVAA